MSTAQHTTLHGSGLVNPAVRAMFGAVPLTCAMERFLSLRYTRAPVYCMTPRQRVRDDAV